MRVRVMTTFAGLSLLLAACAAGAVVEVPGTREHPADAAAHVPAFRPAPDPLFAEAPPDPRAESTVPRHGEHAGAGHAHHGAPDAQPRGGGTPKGHAHGSEHGGGHAEHASREKEAAAPAQPERGHAHGSDAPAAASVRAEDDLVRAYLDFVRALAADDFAAARRPLQPMRTAADALVRETRGEAGAAAGRVAAALPAEPKTIEDLRRDLKPLSEALLTLVRVSPPTTAAAPQLRNWYCPMAGAAWLQAEEQAANPYFGAKMPRCGRVTETIEARTHDGRK